ncbi:HK97-gp10 family putative phage morphogenesis protein [Szabonella alba]|uniref:HK97 gp10 family phage protein n=1 Tax=Szabonella alba TaxID=2804194 RepID=A0A8K0VAK9_9RHOB|nr:HK97-gp10 family putative phage morphogenesis protein [Szabonella alba]MBL4917451.1 HK97 gp10 family phage protein [Szabonella alba]
MPKRVTGSEALAKRMAAIPQSVLEALRPALTRSVQEIAADARALAESSRRSGALVESIEATAPGETTPAFASDGGRRTADEGQAFVTAGDPDARHGHLVEFGTAERVHKDGSPTGTMPAKPFLLPAWRLNKTRVRNRLRRVIRSEVKKGAAE